MAGPAGGEDLRESEKLIVAIGDHGIHRVVQQDTLAVTAGKSGAEIIDISGPRVAPSIRLAPLKESALGQRVAG